MVVNNLLNMTFVRFRRAQALQRMIHSTMKQRMTWRRMGLLRPREGGL